MITPTPFAAILESQPPWWRLGAGGALVVVAYLGMLFAALSLGSQTAPPLAAAAPQQLVVTLLDRPPVEPTLEVKPAAANGTTPSLTSRPHAREPVRRVAAPAPVPVHTTPAKPQRPAASVEPTPAPSAVSAFPAPAAVSRQPTAASGAARDETARSSAPQVSGSASGTGAGARAGAEVTVLPFIDGMTRPKLVDMVAPRYTREARDANVKGLFLAKCVITTSGTLRKCRVMKGLPMMDQAVLSALSRWRYTPVIYQGKPVAVDYVIQVRLAGPE